MPVCIVILERLEQVRLHEWEQRKKPGWDLGVREESKNQPAIAGWYGEREQRHGPQSGLSRDACVVMRWIFTKDEVADHELDLSLKAMAITTEPAQTEELGVGDGELGVGRVGGKV